MSKLREKSGRRSLLDLCLGVLGRHLEDIAHDLHCISPFLPASVKMTLLAIARRKSLVNDELLLALVDESWGMLDVAGSEVTDAGLERALQKCSLIKAVDLRWCNNLTASSVQALVQNCPLIETLRCGGTTLSNAAAKRSLRFIVPALNLEVEAEDSWETLELSQVGKGAQALRWLVWPEIDQDSYKQLQALCPKVVVNPAGSASQRRRNVVPCEALPDVDLDSPAVIGIDPEIWSVQAAQRRENPKIHAPLPSESHPSGLSIAERFKLAFMERDERLASKRAKNLRQKHRRAEKAWLGSDTNAKALVWAGVAQRSMKR